MKLLLDTHVFIWWINGSPRLSARCTEAVRDEASRVFVSLASVWEIAIKAGLKRFEVPRNMLAFVRHNLSFYDFTLLPIEMEHAVAVRHLPLHHHDPFDRMLIAQSRVEGMTLASSDRHFTTYGIDLVW